MLIRREKQPTRFSPTVFERRVGRPVQRLRGEWHNNRSSPPNQRPPPQAPAWQGRKRRQKDRRRSRRQPPAQRGLRPGGRSEIRRQKSLIDRLLELFPNRRLPTSPRLKSMILDSNWLGRLLCASTARPQQRTRRPRRRRLPARA